MYPVVRARAASRVADLVRASQRGVDVERGRREYGVTVLFSVYYSDRTVLPHDRKLTTSDG